jgi:mannose-6-phosphate isomerase class I
MSIVNRSEETVVDLGEYNKSIQYSELKELSLSNKKESIEALARFPTISNEGSKDVDVQHFRVEIISISSDNSCNSSDSDSKYSNSSNKTKEL